MFISSLPGHHITVITTPFLPILPNPFRDQAPFTNPWLVSGSGRRRPPKIFEYFAWLNVLVWGGSNTNPPPVVGGWAGSAFWLKIGKAVLGHLVTPWWGFCQKEAFSNFDGENAPKDARERERVKNIPFF